MTNVIFNFEDRTSQPVSVQAVKLTPSADVICYSGSITLGYELSNFKTDTNGNLTLSNVIPGLYTITITNKGISFNILVPETNGGTVNAKDCITTSTKNTVNSSSQAWPISVSDSRYAMASQAVTMPITVTSSVSQDTWSFDGKSFRDTSQAWTVPILNLERFGAIPTATFNGQVQIFRLPTNATNPLLYIDGGTSLFTGNLVEFRANGGIQARLDKDGKMYATGSFYELDPKRQSAALGSYINITAASGAGGTYTSSIDTQTVSTQRVNFIASGTYTFQLINTPPSGQCSDVVVYITNYAGADLPLSIPSTWANFNGGWPTTLPSGKGGILWLHVFDDGNVNGTMTIQN